MKRFNIQLHDHVTRGVIQTSGGVCGAYVAGASAKIAIATSDGGTLATSNNPKALTNGLIEFWTADTVLSVDLYGMAPGGQFFVAKGIAASGPNEIYIDSNARHQAMIIPFDIDDTTATTETDTGFDLPENAVVLPEGVGVRVTTLDAGMDIDVGILASEANGDANGFMDTILLTTAGMVMAEVGFDVGSSAVFMDLTGGDAEFTYGALLLGAGTKVSAAEGSDSNTDEGFFLVTTYVGDGTAESISYTLSSSTDTGVGFIVLPYMLTGV